MTDKNAENKKVIEGEVRELIEKKILFNPPKHDVVIDIGEIVKTVKIIDTKVLCDYVVVSGFLNKSILYKTAKKEDAKDFLDEDKEDRKGKDKKEDREDKEDKEDKEKDKDGAKCESLVPECTAVDGVVRHVTTWIPFESLVKVKGAHPCDDVEIVCAEVLEPLEEKRIADGKFILGIIEKDIVKISVIVKKD